MVLYGEDGIPPSSGSLRPDDPKPKYWNNVPKANLNDPSQVNPLQEMNLMRQEQKAHQVGQKYIQHRNCQIDLFCFEVCVSYFDQISFQAKVKAEQAAMIDKSEEAEDPWYNDESNHMQVC